MLAADVMTLGAVTIRPEAPIEEAARAMIEQRVSGLPVVNDRGHLVGVVTEGDLLRRQASDTGQGRPRWLELVIGRESPDDGPRLARLATVADVMTRPAISVHEDTPVQEVAEILQRHGIKRVPVVKDGKVTGIVSRADLLRGLARLAENMPEASAADRVLRQRVLDSLAQLSKDGWRSLNVAVRDGEVELRGATADPALHKRLVAAARGVPGVKEVEDRIVVVGAASGRT
jgi:CBS domain-containing protein